ncbi:MAG: V-type ATP synthase subunit D [Candidatus Jordarchaeaceae archaeon]
MSTESLEVHPTRQELLRLKQRKALAEGIADILQKDLETLIVALIDYVKKKRSLQNQLYEQVNNAYLLFAESEMILGTTKVKAIASSAAPTKFHIKVSKTPGILGIPLPTFNNFKVEDAYVKPRFNPVETPIQLYETAEKVGVTVNSLIKLAELTATIRIILEVIALKRRQINRINFKIIPQIDATIRYVELILEEIERQDAIRVRVLQRKRKER